MKRDAVKSPNRKKLPDLLLGIAIAFTVVYILYQKGFILAGFESVTPKQAYEMLRTEGENVLLLDVRTQAEYDRDGRLQGAVVIPLQVLEHRTDLLKEAREKKILVYCRSGNRSVTASRILLGEGFEVYNVKGGIGAWKSEGLPLIE